LGLPDSVKGAAAPVLGALGAAAGALGGVAAGKPAGGAEKAISSAQVLSAAPGESGQFAPGGQG
jgi:hypothetical protein